jgi:hypothetical protein
MTNPNQPSVNPGAEDLVKAQAGEAAAARMAEQPGATPDAIEGAKQATAEAAGRLLGINIVDNSSGLLAEERNQAAEYWRDIANNPNVTEARRAEARSQAVGVQAEADGHAGVTDSTIRPEGYKPLSKEEIAASKAKVMSMRRV